MFAQKFSSLTRRNFLVAAAAAPAVALAGCSSSSSSGSGVTITVQQHANWTPMMNVLIKEFEKANPGVKVKPIIIDDKIKTSLNTQYLTGANPPDVALIPTNSPTYPQLLKAKALEPLTDVWAAQKLEQRFGAATSASLTASDGVRYVATIDTIYYNIAFYSIDAFAKAGIVVPKDHRIADNAALYDIAKKLRATGVQPLAFEGNAAGRYGWMIDQLLQSAASEAQMKNYLTNFNVSTSVTAKFTDDAFVKSVQTLKDWADNKVFPDGFLGQSDSLALGLFQQGRAGMYLGGNFSISDLTKSGMKYGWLLLPGVAGGAPAKVPTYVGESMAIAAKSKHKAEAKKFLELWLSDEMQAAAVTNTGFALPAVNTVPLTALTNLDPIAKELVDDVKQNGGPAGWTSVAPGAFAQTIVGTNIQAMLAGEKTVAQVVAAQVKALADVRGEK